MATTSPDNIRTPDPGDPYNLVADLATMALDVQNALNGKTSNLFKGTAAQRAAAVGTATAGQLWQDTDGIQMLWRKSGTTWVPAVWRWSGTAAQMNAFTQAPNGFEWFNTTDNSEYVRLSGAWVVKPGATISAELLSAALPSNSYLVMSNAASWSITNNLPGATWNNGIVVGSDGLYRVDFSVLIATSINLFAVIKKNDTSANSNNGVVQQYVHQNTALSPAGGSLTRTIKLVAGDRLVPALYTNGTAGPYGISPQGTSFAVTKV